MIIILYMKGKGFSLGSKKLLIVTIAVAFLLAILAPILYKITKKRLREASKKEIEDLSGLKIDTFSISILFC